MSKPWDSEPTPMTEPYYGRWATYWHDGVSLYDHARDLERQLRHARQLLYQARHGGFATDSSWQDDVDEHFAAAREGGK